MVNFAISFGSFTVGVCCLVIGAAKVYGPAGWIVFGLALMVVGLRPRIRQP